MEIFQLYWWRTTTEIPKPSLIASSHKKPPSQDSNPQLLGAHGLKSMTITTRQHMANVLCKYMYTNTKLTLTYYLLETSN
jgi:hypothetical protein